MAIYDPLDGSIDPRPRCTGNCCKNFSLEYPFEFVKSEFHKYEKGEATIIQNIEIIYPMLIPLGIYQKQELFTCNHLGKNGDCQIYETRPKMCRDFPGPNPCPYRNCASHGKQNLLKRAVNWLRD
ncbi:MAG: YkgJ family cysteine cluster protein [Oligoflexia bacterium]|nr:YkgJ family cysteine cluster protein [Oligoflexia bacterium]